MKVCRICKEEKSFDLFKKSKRSKDGIENHCKSCHVKQGLEYRNKYKGMQSPTSIKLDLKKNDLKECQSCFKIKKLEDFYKKYKNMDHNHFGSTCIDCVKKSNKENPASRKKIKQTYNDKLSLKKYYELNSEFHCIKVCKKHGSLKYHDIGIRLVTDHQVQYLRPYCLLCREEAKYINHNENRRLNIIKNNENILCITCKELLHHSSFTDGSLRSISPSCKPCRYSISKRSESNRMMIKRYGFHVTTEQYDQMLLSQNGVCKICGGLNKSLKRLAIDHCHESHSKGIIKIRGLLCSNCNVSLGGFKDSPDLLRKAILYLEENA